MNRSMRAVSDSDEQRYIAVKRSMAGIKVVLNERHKIQKIMLEKEGIPFLKQK